MDRGTMGGMKGGREGITSALVEICEVHEISIKHTPVDNPEWGVIDALYM